MAATIAGTRLTDRHRTEQLSIRALLLYELTRIWRTITVARLDESTAGWIDILLDLILASRSESSNAALRYYQAFRIAETGAPGMDAELLSDLDVPSVEAIRTSLLFTGPVSFQKNLDDGMGPEAAQDLALVRVSGAAGRHALDGGRETATNLARRDELAVGLFARVTGEDPCYFCAMLASRGPVYKSELTAGARNRTSVRNPNGIREFVGTGAYKFHDHCQCTIEPVFDRNGAWPGRAREFEQLYKDVTANASGQDKLREFRRAYEGRRRTTSDS